MTSVELAKHTGQDPRSIHGRVLLLCDLGLVQRFPMITKGMTTHLVVYKKFVDGNRRESAAKAELGVDINELRKGIVTKVKEAKNQLRQFQDLKVELGFDKTSRQFIIFGRAVRLLESQGFVKRVIVHTTDKITKRDYKIKCIKFVSDLTELDIKGDSDLSDESDFAEVDEAGGGGEGDEKGGEGESGAGGAGGSRSAGEGSAVPDISQIEPSALVKIDDESNILEGSEKKVLFNQFYPIEIQIYDAINSGGKFGIPAMDLCRNVVGAPYTRTFSRILETLSDKSANAKSTAAKKKALAPPKNLEYLTFIRGIDFSARMKFYRYFSQTGYSIYAQEEPRGNWGSWKEINLTGAHRSLRELEKKCFCGLPGLVEVLMDEHGNSMPLFHGEKTMKGTQGVVINSAPRQVPTGGKKLGRPRKRPVEEGEASTPVKERKPKKPKVESDTPKLTKTGKVRRKPGTGKYALAKAAERAAAEAAAAEARASETAVQDTSVPPTPAERVVSERPSETPVALSEAPSTPTPVIKIKVEQEIPTSVPLTNMEVDRSPTPNIYSTPVQQPATIPSSPSITPDLHPIVHPEGPVSVTPMQVDEPETPDTLAIPAATPTPSIKTKPKPAPLPQRAEISFALIKRMDQILSIIKEHRGVFEGGTVLMNEINAKYAASYGSSIDRKTVKKIVNQMIASGKLSQILVTVPRDIYITKELLCLPSVDHDSEEVVQAKAAITEGVRKKTVPPPKKIFAVEKSEFKYYTIRDIRSSRLVEHDKKKKEAEVRKQAKAIRDIEKEEKKKEMKEEKAKEKAEARALAKAKALEKRRSMTSSNTAKKEPKRQKMSNKTSTTSMFPDPSNTIGYSPAMPMIPAHPLSYQPHSNGTSAAPLHFIPSMTANTMSAAPRPARRRAAPSAPSTPTGPKRRTRNAFKLDLDRFFRVVIIVRSLFSTALGVIDWNHVITAFPGLTAEAAKTKWARVRELQGGSKQIPRAIKKWEKLFVDSYRNGELPVIENESYDVGFYADYWKANEDELDMTGVPWLFEKAEDFEKEYDIVDIETDNMNQPLEYTFTSNSMVKTDELMTSVPFGIRKYGADPLISPLDKVKQAIKGTILTSYTIYEPELSKQILLDQGPVLVSKSIEELERDKIIVYIPRDKEKVLPGRNYLVSEKFNAFLELRIGNGVFYDATEFEKQLMNTLQSGKGMIMSKFAPDSSLVSILDLICHRNIDLVRVNPVAGLPFSGYKLRGLETDKLDGDIILRKVVANREGLAELERPNVPVPLGNPCQYSWTSIKGTVNEEIWHRLIKLTLMTIVYRPGISTVALHNRLSLVVTYEEIGKILQWLCERGCLRRGECDSYYVGPRWYSNIFA